MSWAPSVKCFLSLCKIEASDCCKSIFKVFKMHFQSERTKGKANITNTWLFQQNMVWAQWWAIKIKPTALPWACLALYGCAMKKLRSKSAKKSKTVWATQIATKKTWLWYCQKFLTPLRRVFWIADLLSNFRRRHNRLDLFWYFFGSSQKSTLGNNLFSMTTPFR